MQTQRSLPVQVNADCTNRTNHTARCAVHRLDALDTLNAWDDAPEPLAHCSRCGCVLPRADLAAAGEDYLPEMRDVTPSLAVTTRPLLPWWVVRYA